MLNLFANYDPTLPFPQAPRIGEGVRYTEREDVIADKDILDEQTGAVLFKKGTTIEVLEHVRHVPPDGLESFAVEVDKQYKRVYNDVYEVTGPGVFALKAQAEVDAVLVARQTKRDAKATEDSKDATELGAVKSMYQDLKDGKATPRQVQRALARLIKE